jgi:hypothetical protein
MSNELAKQQTDGFEGFQDQTEGGSRQGGGVIQGTVLKFSNESCWTIHGEKMPQGIELIAVDINRIVQKWKDQLPVETMILEPRQKFPDIEELNDKTPRNEWVEGPDGKQRGPWQRQHVLYLIDPQTMDRYSYPTGTIGGAIAVREVADKTRLMRKFRGQNVYAVVTLSDVHMNTKFGGRQRPHFIVQRWIELGDEEKALPAPVEAARLVENSATPAPVQATKSPEKKTETTQRGVTPRRGVTTVKEPGLREELNDEIPEAPWEDRSTAAADGDRSPEAAKARLEDWRSKRRGG